MSPLFASDEFTQMIRLLNTNVNGKEKIVFALTKIRGIGRRFSEIICKKGEINLTKRAGEFTVQGLEKLMEIVSNPREYKIPSWFMNHSKDRKSGTTSQITVSQIDGVMRETLERLKKLRSHRGIRHCWGVRVRGQHTKTNSRGSKRN